MRPDCPTCGGKGWVDDGSTHHGICLACASPTALKFTDPKTFRRQPSRMARKANQHTKGKT